MPPSKIVAYLAEMPVIAAWLESERKRTRGFGFHGDMQPRQIFVSGVDLSFLDYKLVTCRARQKKRDPAKFDFTGEDGSIKDFYESIYFLDEFGNQIMYKVERVSHPRKYIFFGPRRERRRSYEFFAIAHSITDLNTPLKVLAFLKDKIESVRYAVSYCDFTGALIIYRSPDGKPLWNRIQEQAALHSATIAAEIANAD